MVNKLHKKTNLIQKFELFLVKTWINFLNLLLNILNTVFFKTDKKNPKKILIYKLGNIGDIVCSVPALIVIRKNFPKARITLLTSPGEKGAPGAIDILKNAWYLDQIHVYYSGDISSLRKKKKLIKELKSENYDLFIQLPDCWADLKTMLRNIVFTKLIGVKSAFGFRLSRTKIFKKTQTKFLFNKQEVSRLLQILNKNKIKIDNIQFDFNIPEKSKRKVDNILNNKWPRNTSLLIAVGSGAKREANRWPPERFGEVANYLQKKHNAKIIIVGGKSDLKRARIISNFVNKRHVLVAVGKLNLLETIELFKRCSFIISNDTGTIHMAASVGLPAVGLYNIRNLPGSWFPYGKNHEIIYHTNISCDYKNEECIKKSLMKITVDEVKKSCELMLNKINFTSNND